ncbi:hypothetical protein DCE79_08245 [Lysinibacillus sp. 2017]|uniref:HAAS signaling domain-containing protein n=1 Tax=unclassified Lysinibacillus TaxID=2636778 RepID=UPI000D527C24|nr:MULTISPECIES: hypothetical protein [unclassified Lysinibacillus]AWE09264.1 hypothetical protein DCE79_08245 [Lysinibacillus sp. 2017]TGN36868.1 hypothetical protein E4L99_02965 [Lysinibacillus sp. S2017]
MRLIEVYIQEVTRRLPERMRTDIALELRSTIEDMLPDNYREEHVKRVLNQLGNPAVLANGYKDQPMHLIGPRYFDLYVSLLKMIVPIAIVISLISIIAQNFIGYSGEESILNVVITIIVKGIGSIIEVGIQVFFWLTLTFAIIERVDKDKDPQPVTSSMEKWTADDLKNITYIPKRKAISKFEVFGSLMWTAIWATLYFYASQLVGVYEGDGDRFEFVIPALNQEVLLSYRPIIVMIIVFEIALSLYKLLKEQWTKRMAIFNTILQIIITIVFTIIITNPNIMNQAFITYMTDWKDQQIVGILIFIFIIGAAVNVYDGFKRVRAR